MTILDDLKQRFQVWFQNVKLSMIDKSYKAQLLLLPSEKFTDYYLDPLTQEWVYKEKITQVGFENILNLMKVNIDTINTNIGTINTAITSIEGHQVDIDVNIDTVKDLDIEISEQVNKAVNYSGTVAINTLTKIATVSKDFVMNAMTIRLTKPNEKVSADFFIIYDNCTLFHNTVINETAGYNDTFYFTPARTFDIYIKNKSTIQVLSYAIKFFYVQSAPKNIFQNNFETIASATESLYILDENLHNRVSFISYSTVAIDYTINIYTKLYHYGGDVDVPLATQNVAGTGVITYEIPFTPSNRITIELINNSANIGKVYLSLFFSNLLDPSFINLADLNEKNHTSLTNVLTDQHHEKTAGFLDGVANHEWIPCAYMDTYDVDTWRCSVGVLYNIGATNTKLSFMLPLPTNRDGKKLYIDGIRISVMQANATNYVDFIQARGLTFTGAIQLAGLVIGTNRTTAGLYPSLATAVDCSIYEQITCEIAVITANLHGLRLTGIHLRCYYDD